MLRSKAKTWVLLGYLVLLLNFGPSLHHAPIFGLHGHVHRVSDQAPSSCCCHSHAHQQTLIPSLSAELSTASFDAAGDVQPVGHECSFCKFFDEYNVVVTLVDADILVSPFSLFISEHPDGASAQIVPNIARGPPIA